LVKIETLTEEFADFWDDLMREAEVSGDPQQAAFFRLYGELAAENGDCADLIYTPISRDGSRGYQVDGYAFDQDRGELHLAVCDFSPGRQIQALNAARIKQVFQRVKRFCDVSVDAEYVQSLEETSPTFELAWFLLNNRELITRVRCVMFTNSRLATRKKTIEAGRVFGAKMTFNIIDFPRYVQIQQAQGGVEPIELDVRDLNGQPLPCLDAHLDDSDYESYLVVMPGSLLARIYGLYGARLMEQNVRAFLQARTKANQGIIRTANEEPEMFFAYNNGITATASGVEIEDSEDGTKGITSIRDLQVVNGGQTTASLLYASDKGNADLSKVFVQMKLSVVASDRIDAIVPLISRYANTQNRISEADFFSSHPLHVEMQQISRRLAAPATAGSLASTRWFYERARGQYRNEGALKTVSEKRRFQAEFPRSQVIQKTDLAKYDVTFQARPHVVSLGAQKCFLQYAHEIGDAWKKSRDSFNEDFFRVIVSKAILFRTLDKSVGRSEWYKADRGYKANIITYTLAWLVWHLSNKHDSCIDFDLVWKLQAVPQDFQDCLDGLAPQIAGLLKSPPSGVSNISEYAKSQECWKRISSAKLRLDDCVLSYVVDRGQAGKQESGSGRTNPIEDESDLERLLSANLKRISELEKVAREKRLLSPLSSRAFSKLKRGNITLVKSERNSLKHLFKRLDKIGLGPNSWEDNSQT